ncbi:MAG: HGGxSTG domain-containing protein [Betaproteobacteria bacterium]
MICGAKTKAGSPCKKPPLQGRARCRLHGGMSLSGKDHPNYKHGHCTKESRRQNAYGNAHVKFLESLLIRLGMIEPKRRKRNTMF